MEHEKREAQRREAVALAELLKIFAGMLLMAAVGCLLLGGYGYDRDWKARKAMEKAVATVTEEDPRDDTWYITYEADGAAHKALLIYTKKGVQVGDRVDILYDPACYEDVRTDKPIPQPLYVLGAGVLCLALGGLGMAGQAYMKGKYDTPWDDWRA